MFTNSQKYDKIYIYRKEAKIMQRIHSNENSYIYDQDSERFFIISNEYCYIYDSVLETHFIINNENGEKCFEGYGGTETFYETIERFFIDFDKIDTILD